jgi:ferrochelatase
MSGGPWIGPTVEDTMRKLRDEGHRGVLIQPVGFLCDHVEVLYDIDITFRKFGSNIGLEVWRTESLNDAPLLISALAELVRESLNVEPVALDGCPSQLEKGDEAFSS